jgi:hypothetical protein
MLPGPMEKAVVTTLAFTLLLTLILLTLILLFARTLLFAMGAAAFLRLRF